MTGIKSPGRGPHLSRLPDHAPITTFDPRARLFGSSLVALVVLAFIAALIVGRP